MATAKRRITLDDVGYVIRELTDATKADVVVKIDVGISVSRVTAECTWEHLEGVQLGAQKYEIRVPHKDSEGWHAFVYRWLWSVLTDWNRASMAGDIGGN